MRRRDIPHQSSLNEGILHVSRWDTFLFVSHTTNVVLFKFLCNILISGKIIKEMPGSVASGTLCISSFIAQCHVTELLIHKVRVVTLLNVDGRDEF